MRDFAAVILAAGKGTRMKSDLHKVLHPIGGQPMLHHLMASVDKLGPSHTVVVVGSGHEQIESAVSGRATTVLQEPQVDPARVWAVTQAASTHGPPSLSVDSSETAALISALLTSLHEQTCRSSGSSSSSPPREAGRISSSGFSGSSIPDATIGRRTP